MELEGCNCAGGVGTNSRQVQQGLVRGRESAPEIARDTERAVAKAQSPRWVTQVAPFDKDLGGGCFRQICGSWPQTHPALPNRLNARDGGLLAHDLKNKRAPRGNIIGTHGKIAAMKAVPLHDGTTGSFSFSHGHTGSLAVTQRAR